MQLFLFCWYLVVSNRADVDTIADTAFNQWKNHDEHNKNMLGNNFSATGLSVVELANGQFFALQDFAGKGSADIEWNADQYNSALASDVGLTTSDIEARLKVTP
ncbi:CAP domain-containing protein [Companilactobacillus insicii]|uniref:CAP domain-containing protein n=1 Tax=Companilactobacillus insicii TaxID=1732567 RepID=UPI000F79078F|nr:CAP domain-containing protein [Companilactobacillus insicii]